nr:hypothetical protein BaRGS_002691 [Batillaria attramentaria]
MSAGSAGQTKQDTDNMGEVRYLPEDQGFPYYFYPYRNQWKYLQPFVMVVFTHLKPNVKVQVQCRVWAPGIEVIPLERQGSVHFTLLYKKEVL